MTSPIEQTADFIYHWLHDSFAKPTADSNYFPRDPRHPDATVEGQDNYSAKNIAYNFKRQLVFGGSRIQHATVTRTDGTTARQVMCSVGFPLGRLSMRNTLNPTTNFPNALHGELILGFKPFSIGASIGRTFKNLDDLWSRKGQEVMFTWFKRFQWSVTAPDKEVTRIVSKENVNLIRLLRLIFEPTPLYWT